MRYAFLVLATTTFLAGPALAGATTPGAPAPFTPITTLPPKQGFSYPDCYCTDTQGRRVEIGQMACLQVGRRNRMALCDMSQNNPTWRFSGEMCPVS